MLWFVAGILICVAVAGVAALGLDRIRPAWRPIRIAALAGLPLPAIVLAACVYFFVDAGRSPPARCGVDACGMVMLVTSAIGAVALVAFVCSWLAAWLVVRNRRGR